MTDLETAIKYYQDLLLYQYINAPRARATIGLLVSQALADLLPNTLAASFDIDTAVGAQLDILGEYIGFSRTIPAVIPRTYFTADDYTAELTPTTAYGMTDYTQPNLNANYSFYSYFFYNTATNVLEDSEYRLLLKLKILLNTSDNTLANIVSMMYEFFGTDLIVCDQCDMSMSYYIDSAVIRIVTIAKGVNLLPKPMGVLLTGVFAVNSTTDVWAMTDYTRDTGATIGFSSYTGGWAAAEFLNYGNAI